MNLIMLLIDSIATFIRRNPLLCLILVMLALLAPSALKGIAAFILYFILGILLFGVIILLTIRWRFRRLQREMQEQFGASGGFRTYGAYGPSQQQQQQRQQPKQEGEVKVYMTNETPEKRIAGDVGDYVEFEETKAKR